MKIHRFSEGDTLERVAEENGISVDTLRLYNDISDIPPALGEELAILTPTRTYRTVANDTLERISLRFAVKKSRLISINPGLGEGVLPVGREVALRFGERAFGTALGNGYFYPECTRERLDMIMPYLTYVTFCVAHFSGEKIELLDFDRAALGDAVSAGKIPLLRIYEQDKREKYKSPDKFIGECIRVATEGGFKGITINLEDEESYERAAELLINMRRELLGCDLILITEVGEGIRYDLSDYSDGSVVCYPKYAMEKRKAFNDGERAFFSEFADRAESAKCFIDLPALAVSSGRYFDIGRLLKTARRERAKIEYDEEKMLSSVTLGAQKYTFTPLSNIKAILDTVNEYGYMGISFDIMRIPMPYLYAYGTMFSTMAYSGIVEHSSCREA